MSDLAERLRKWQSVWEEVDERYQQPTPVAFWPEVCAVVEEADKLTDEMPQARALTDAVIALARRMDEVDA
jgi:hypothetical protein